MKEEIVKQFLDKFFGLVANLKRYGETNVPEFIITEKKSEQDKNEDQEKHQEQKHYTRINMLNISTEKQIVRGKKVGRYKPKNDELCMRIRLSHRRK